MLYLSLAGSDALRLEVGARIARWIARESEKEAARAFGVSPRTVKSWRAGQLPQMRHLMAMASRWGEAFLDDVFAPVLSQDTKLTVRLERLEAEIAAIRREVTRTSRESAGAAPGGEVLARHDIGHDSPAVNGIPLPEPRRWEAYRDESRNRVEVAWFDLEALRHETLEMQAFARAMRSVAGGPPSWETVSANTLALTSVHLVDVSANAPDDYNFRRLGWTGIDMYGVNRVGDIPAEALKINARHSYLDVKVFGEPSYSHVRRKLSTGEHLIYTRLIWPALSSHHSQLLWVGMRRDEGL